MVTITYFHFEVGYAPDDQIDPYAGPCNAINSESWWIDQPPYYDSALVAALTGWDVPQTPPCPETEQPNTRRVFAVGERVYFTGAWRDELDSLPSQLTVRRPDGSLFAIWTYQPPFPHRARSRVTWSYSLAGNPAGVWTFAIDYNGVVHERAFEVVEVGDGDGDAILDHQDNCMLAANANQFDADDDGYGNVCDADFNNDGVVNAQDLGFLKTVYFSTDEVVDLNVDGVVNSVDLGRFKLLFFTAPGPSAYVP